MQHTVEAACLNIPYSQLMLAKAAANDTGDSCKHAQRHRRKRMRMTQEPQHKGRCSCGKGGGGEGGGGGRNMQAMKATRSISGMR